MTLDLNLYSSISGHQGEEKLQNQAGRHLVFSHLNLVVIANKLGNSCQSKNVADIEQHYQPIGIVLFSLLVNVSPTFADFSRKPKL